MIIRYTICKKMYERERERERGREGERVGGRERECVSTNTAGAIMEDTKLWRRVWHKTP
jgi:hypothetical protein